MPPHNDVEAFHEVLRSSRRILALCGAGLSASSGLPTFRGAGGLWRMHEATKLATMRAFMTDPGLVWLFYGYRRHLALTSKPNPGHRALAALANKNPDFLCLTQNVDDLSQRANHPSSQLCTLHGSLFDVKCTTKGCGWIQRGNFDDPFCPALAPASEDPPPGEPLPLLDPYHRIKHVSDEELPKCPQCQTGIQRPGVVWFGEKLDEDMIEHINEWITKDKIAGYFSTFGRGKSAYMDLQDLMLVVGTSAQVYPAAGYISRAKLHGARIVTVNPEAEDETELYKIQPGDFAFGQDAAEYLPKLLEPVIGKLQENGEFEN
ncbi:NAD-dependent histone deacetylase, silent information regulator Sir2 [Pochonia chlamydosporia 170]|uniref:NAD-dependent histone deacetylase, silent information regulator Sir2 n=1 Tax=Pochonia chlamydosporia 170 TaxID=1380566 RepID=A0A179G9E8_METCM|nr:NAD-dependent histone deacetylase, silent information regulator Sir2 [Pochonia chlamydosporia 170]OAQ74041.1 NAD-dependent histone deacetylase, silent information regulator Sir2 [Pochonia chlamydosporia 170]